MAPGADPAHGQYTMRWLVRNVFLVDGLGAVASAATTLTIVLTLQRRFGMPVSTLWALVLLALGFMAYSLGCWAKKARLRPWLPVVMAANLGYCVVVGVAVGVHASEMTTLGTAYFVGEMVVIVGVVVLEWNVLQASMNTPFATASATSVRRAR